MHDRARLAAFSELVKLSHSVFALPFALVMVVLLSREQAVELSQLVLIVSSVVFARTAAMGFNRIVDSDIDAINPRTSQREIPSGKISRRAAVALVGTATGGFLLSAGLLGRHCLVLAVPVLAVLFGYSYLKRFSALCHVVLGLALALAPGGVWYALTGIWSLKPLPLMVAVLVWVAGFDILYSCQDEAFDREQRLHSVPTLLGVRGAIQLAAILHAASVAALALTGFVFGCRIAYFFGVVGFALLLASQYGAVRRKGISCIDQVFFTRNGFASVAFFVIVVVDSLL